MDVRLAPFQSTSRLFYGCQICYIPVHTKIILWMSDWLNSGPYQNYFENVRLAPFRSIQKLFHGCQIGSIPVHIKIIS